MTINAVNDAPVGTPNTVGMLEDGNYVFSKADFGFTDPHDNPNNLFLSVKITTLPSVGSLTLNNGASDGGEPECLHPGQ